MYRVATALTPESLERISRVAFDELFASGVRTVGEFHYIHHQADGTPYEDRTLLSDIVVSAARAAGLRVCVLRVAYNRAGPGAGAEPVQKRFCDGDVDTVLRDVDTLRAKYKHDPDVRVGVAPHSVRAQFLLRGITPLAGVRDEARASVSHARRVRSRARSERMSRGDDEATRRGSSRISAS